MNADLDRLQGGFKMNRFSIEPMIFNLEHIFSSKICITRNRVQSIVCKVSQTVKFEVNDLRVYSKSVRYSNSKTRVKIIKYDFEQSIGSYYIVNHE